jgi:hypothetical protein
MNNAKQLLPSVQPVPTQNETSCNVIAFDFVLQPQRLLQNCRIMIQDNLVLDMQNPLQQYKSLNGNIVEALSGSVYREAYLKYVKHPEWELFVPIIQWIDRTWNFTDFHTSHTWLRLQYSRRSFVKNLKPEGTTAFFPNHEHRRHRIKFDHKATTFGNTMPNFKLFFKHSRQPMTA